MNTGAVVIDGWTCRATSNVVMVAGGSGGFVWHREGSVIIGDARGIPLPALRWALERVVDLLAGSLSNTERECAAWREWATDTMKNAGLGTWTGDADARAVLTAAVTGS